MIVIVAASVETAAKLDEAVDGMRRFSFAAPSDDKAMRAKIHSWQPSVVVMDVRAGRSYFRAIDSIERIKKTVTSKPAIIVAAPDVPKELRDTAARMGAFDVVSLRPRTWRSRLRETVEAALEAWESGALPSLGVKFSEPLH